MKLTAFPSVDSNFNLLKTLSTSLDENVTITVNASNLAQFDIPAFRATFMDHSDELNPHMTKYNYPGSVGNVISNITQGSTFISVSNTGVVVQTVNYPTSEQLKTHVVVGNLIHQSGNIDFIYTLSAVPVNAISSSFTDLALAIGSINISGNVISGNGANLKVNKSAGKSFFLGINSGSPLSPNVTTDDALSGATFFSLFRNGTGGWTITTTDVLTVNKYDNNVAGGVTAPVTTLSNNKWQLFKVYHIPAPRNQLAIEYGQKEYASASAAIAGIPDAVSQAPATEVIKFRGWFAIRGGATSLTSTDDAIFIDGGKFGNATSAAGTSTTALQGSYDNSITPEILTDATRGALSVKRGSAADTDNVFEGQNGAGTTTFSVNGNGNVGATSLTITSTTQGLILPRMTTTQMNAISTPVAGTVVYNTTTNKMYIRGAATWEAVVTL